jgi:nucleoside-diphosphate-sugar epimerase
MGKTIIIGAGGQIGTELTLTLRNQYSTDQIIAADIKEVAPTLIQDGPYVQMDILNRDSVRSYIIDNQIETVYLLAALLSATAEKNPDFAWKLNMEGLFTILDLAKEGHVKKIFWPSSIAVFGPTTPADNTPQHTVMEPSTVYGISKQAGERWCEYYYNKFGVDVRSIRYPGLISYKSPPGGGTTDYAVDIFYKAKQEAKFTCFLSKDTALPMMFMDDAITRQLRVYGLGQHTTSAEYHLPPKKSLLPSKTIFLHLKLLMNQIFVKPSLIRGQIQLMITTRKRIGTGNWDLIWNA